MSTLKTVIIAFIAGVLGAFAFSIFQANQSAPKPVDSAIHTANSNGENFYEPITREAAINSSSEVVDFSLAATKATPSVVYINSISQSGISSSYWDLLFGGSGLQPQVSSGSGVIFTKDGYIVTNNHVIESAEKIQVLYNKKSYDAELIGTDPSTDLAVLKIEVANAPAITLGNSKSLAVGEWVMAVGNPFSLSSTVTVGIVSAKGRRINIVEDKFPIESFIQTDAAINPGNSGGALVNKYGELVGINTAILSRTGSYTGYAFAVPIDIAKKVVNDLIKYGLSQKAIFGGDILEYDYENAKKLNLNLNVDQFRGVLVGAITKGEAASRAGIKEGDVITKLNDIEINSKSTFEEELSYRYPGDQITITYTRDGKQTNTLLTLLNKNGNTDLVKRKLYNDATLGATLEVVDYGVKVSKIKNGIFKRIGIPENYTIVSINRKRVTDPKDISDFFNAYKGAVYLYGFNSSRQEMPFSFYLR